MKSYIFIQKSYFAFFLIFFLFTKLFAQNSDTYEVETEKTHKNTKFDSFIGDNILSLDLGYLGTGLKNNGWGAGLHWEVELFRYFSIRPGFSHMTLFPKDEEFNITTVGIEFETFYYPFGRGLDWLYLGIGEACDFIEYVGDKSKESESAISVFPKIGWKQNFMDYVMVDFYTGYKIYLNEGDFRTSADGVINRGFQYGVNLRFNIKKIAHFIFHSEKSQ